VLPCGTLLRPSGDPGTAVVWPLWTRCNGNRSRSTTGRRPSPHTVHTSRGDQPKISRRGHSIGNAAKWSTPSSAGTRRGWVGMDQTEPGSLPSGLPDVPVEPEAMPRMRSASFRPDLP
jgi:hypothetical protein